MDAKLVAILAALSVAGVALYFIFDATLSSTDNKPVSEWEDSDLIKTCASILEGNVDERTSALMDAVDADSDLVLATMQGICSSSFYLKPTDTEGEETLAEFKKLDQIATYNICSESMYYTLTYRQIFQMYQDLLYGTEEEGSAATALFMETCAPDWKRGCAADLCTTENLLTCENDCLEDIFNVTFDEDGTERRRLHEKWTHRNLEVSPGLKTVQKAGRDAFHTLVEVHMANNFEEWTHPESFVPRVPTSSKNLKGSSASSVHEDRKLVSADPYAFPGFCNFPNGPTFADGSSWEDNRNWWECNEQLSCIRNNPWGEQMLNEKKIVLNNMQGWMTDGNEPYIWGCKAGQGKAGQAAGEALPPPWNSRLSGYLENNRATWTAPNGKTATIYEPCNAQAGLDFDKIICDTYDYSAGFSLSYAVWNWGRTNDYTGIMKDDQTMVYLSTMLGMGNLIFHGSGCGGGIPQNFDTKPMDLMFAYFLQLAGGTVRGKDGVAYDPRTLTTDLWAHMKQPYTMWPSTFHHFENTMKYIDYIGAFVQVAIHTCVPQVGVSQIDNWLRDTVNAAVDELGRVTGTPLEPGQANYLPFDPWSCKQLATIAVLFVDAILYQEALLLDHTGSVKVYCVEDKNGILDAFSEGTVQTTREGDKTCFSLHLNNYQMAYHHADETRVPCKYNPHSEWHFKASRVIGEYWALAKAIQVLKAGLNTNQYCYSDEVCNNNNYCGRTTGKCISLQGRGSHCTQHYECASKRCSKFQWSTSHQTCGHQYERKRRSCKWWQWWCHAWYWVAKWVCTTHTTWHSSFKCD